MGQPEPTHTGVIQKNSSGGEIYVRWSAVVVPFGEHLLACALSQFKAHQLKGENDTIILISTDGRAAGLLLIEAYRVPPGAMTPFEIAMLEEAKRVDPTFALEAS